MRQRSFLARTAASCLLAIALLCRLGLMVLTAAAHAEAKPLNPFAAQTGSSHERPGSAPSTFAPPTRLGLRTSDRGAVAGPGGPRRHVSWVVDTQQSMQAPARRRRHKSQDRQCDSPRPWTLAALSFLYGVVHAVGPGHGKTIISSYVVANEETVRRGRDHLLHRRGACRR